MTGRTLNPGMGEPCGPSPTWEVVMRRYLVSISSSTDRTLRRGQTIVVADLDAAISWVTSQLWRQRDHHPRGRAWDTWTVAAPADRGLLPRILASGRIEVA